MTAPHTLLVLDPDGRPAAAWQMDGADPASVLLDAAGELAAHGDLRPYECNPARWRVTDQSKGDGCDPGPPGGLSPDEQHMWVCQWALSAQASIMDSRPGLEFRGTPDGRGPACEVGVQTGGGDRLFRLANTGYRRSPTGFGVGYSGPGAAALARSLLTAALGRRAACPDCAGVGKTTWDVTGERPWCPGDPEDAAGSCFACAGDGIRVDAPVYQAYKEAVVAMLPPGREWTLTKAGVLTWVASNGDRGLAELAAEVPR